MPPGDVDADAPDGPHTLAGCGSRTTPLPRAVHLALVEGANVLYGHREAVLQVERKRPCGTVYLALWNPDLLWPYAVEAFAVFEEGRISPVANVFDDPARRLANLLGEKASRTAQLAHYFAGFPVPRVYISNQRVLHAPA
jgi:hypothetical protein